MRAKPDLPHPTDGSPSTEYEYADVKPIPPDLALAIVRRTLAKNGGSLFGGPVMWRTYKDGCDINVMSFTAVDDAR